jgi:uncharacterized protein (DUF1697 family)
LPRYVAFLRGVSPLNAKMPELKLCFEAAGFTNIKTVLSSGNIIFDARSAALSTLALRAERSMQDTMGRTFSTIIRRADALQALLETDPYAGFAIPPNAKRVVTFLRECKEAKLALPLSSDGASVLCSVDTEVFTAYMPSEKGPVFMTLIEKAFGSDVTTRTWETVRKCAAA